MPKISALTAATALDADDEFYVVEDGNSRKCTLPQIVTGAAASEAQAQAGAATDVLMTPQRAEQHMLANALGWGQTWQELGTDRVLGTSYQNTTGRPIFVFLARSAALTQESAQVSIDGSSWVGVGFTGAPSIAAHFIVPAGWFYRQTGSGAHSGQWAELR
jgi:hypothetical protein